MQYRELYNKMYEQSLKKIAESHTAKEIKSASTDELRKLADVYSKKISVVRQRAKDAEKAGESDKAKTLHSQADDHQDEEMDIRAEIKSRTGMK